MGKLIKTPGEEGYKKMSDEELVKVIDALQEILEECRDELAMVYKIQRERARDE